MHDFRAALREAVFAAIDDLNEMRAADARVVKAPETCLTGEAGVLDSLAFVNFVVALEQRLETLLGLRVNLLDEERLDLDVEPFRTVETLVAHLEQMHRSRALDD